jgi:3-dehydroquinate dehydratase-1
LRFEFGKHGAGGVRKAGRHLGCRPVLPFGCLFGKNAGVKEHYSNPGSPLVVGTVHSPGALARALKLGAGKVDMLELRVDAFAPETEGLLKAARKLAARFPLLLTVRHPAEGGMGGLDIRARRRLFRQFLPLVQWADFEVRSLETLEEEIALACDLDVRLVLSDHHFERTPTLELLQRRLDRAREARLPAVFKVAAQTRSLEDLERLLSFFDWAKHREPGRLSVMGMGEYGRISRLLFGGCGSVLNYGYLDQPQVPGQWPAELLKARLLELGEAGVAR